MVQDYVSMRQAVLYKTCFALTLPRCTCYLSFSFGLIAQFVWRCFMSGQSPKSPKVNVNKVNFWELFKQNFCRPGVLPAVWFTSTETEMSVNRKVLIPLMEMKTKMKKLQKTETKWKQKNLKWKLIDLAMSFFVSVVFPFHAITQVLCNIIWYGSGHLFATV